MDNGCTCTGDVRFYPAASQARVASHVNWGVSSLTLTPQKAYLYRWTDFRGRFPMRH